MTARRVRSEAATKAKQLRLAMKYLAEKNAGDYLERCHSDHAKGRQGQALRLRRKARRLNQLQRASRKANR